MATWYSSGWNRWWLLVDEGHLYGRAPAPGGGQAGEAGADDQDSVREWGGTSHGAFVRTLFDGSLRAGRSIVKRAPSTVTRAAVALGDRRADREAEPRSLAAGATGRARSARRRAPPPEGERPGPSSATVSSARSPSRRHEHCDRWPVAVVLRVARRVGDGALERGPLSSTPTGSASTSAAAPAPPRARARPGRAARRAPAKAASSRASASRSSSSSLNRADVLLELGDHRVVDARDARGSRCCRARRSAGCAARATHRRRSGVPPRGPARATPASR